MEMACGKLELHLRGTREVLREHTEPGHPHRLPSHRVPAAPRRALQTAPGCPSAPRSPGLSALLHGCPGQRTHTAAPDPTTSAAEAAPRLLQPFPLAAASRVSPLGTKKGL